MLFDTFALTWFHGKDNWKIAKNDVEMSKFKVAHFDTSYLVKDKS